MPVWAPFCAREDDRGTAPKVRQARARLAAAQRVSGVMKVMPRTHPPLPFLESLEHTVPYRTKAVVRIVGCGLAGWRGHSRDHRTRTSNELCATVWELDDDLTPSESLSLFACQRPADTRYCSHLSTFCAQLRPPSIIEARFPSSGHRYGITRPQCARRVPLFSSPPR